MTGNWLWIPVVILATVAQTARNAAQRSLVAQAGTLGATLARFLYGTPFAVAAVLLLEGHSWQVPAFTPRYFEWLVLGALGQLGATALMLAAMKQRNFVVGIAYSKTDALQVALLGPIVLGETLGWGVFVAVIVATAGVVLLSVPQGGAAKNLTGKAAWLGLGSGAAFAVSAIGYRGATLQIPGLSPWLAGAWGVLLAQLFQAALLGGYLALRNRASLRALAVEWRVGLLAGAGGALASLGWFTGFAMTTAINVRTVGMTEVVFSLVVSHRLREKVSRREKNGLALLILGLVALAAQR